MTATITNELLNFPILFSLWKRKKNQQIIRILKAVSYVVIFIRRDLMGWNVLFI